MTSIAVTISEFGHINQHLNESLRHERMQVAKAKYLVEAIKVHLAHPTMSTGCHLGNS